MSFLTDATWPPYMATSLSCAKASGNYHGFYKGLISHCFDAFKDEIARVSEKPLLNSPHPIVIQDCQWHALLITHIGSDVSPAGRVNADKQMRRKYYDCLSECLLPRLWGVSFVGPSLRVYCGDAASGTVLPPAKDQLEGAWNIETLSPVGFAVIKEIVRDVVECGAL